MKILLSLIALSVVASASYTTTKKYFDAKEYKQAVKEAKASTDDYSDARLHLLWAKSEDKLGNTKDAMSAYERVCILDENNVEAKLALYNIYKDTQRDALAKELSKDLLHYDLTPAQRSSLELLKGESLSSLKAKATLSIGHDSNINVSAKASVLDDYYGGINGGEESSMFARFNGSVSYINDLEQKGQWYVRGDLKVYYQDNFDAHFYDMLIVGAEAGLGYAGGNYTIYIPFGYSRINYLDVDLLSQVKIQPKINITLSKNFILNLNAKYARRDYQEQRYARMDDDSVAGGAGLYYLFGKNFAYAKFLYEDFSSRASNPFLFIDKNLFTASMGVNYNVKEFFTARLDYRYRLADYDDSSNPKDSSVTSKRSDDYNQVELKLSHYFKDNFSVYISDRYAKNSSNYAPGEYDKNIAMFGINANY